jgi:hypothetical protein
MCCVFPIYREDCSGLNTLKRRPPSPPKRQQSCEDNLKCHQITVVADLHCIPALQSKSLSKWTTDNMSTKHNLEDHIGSNASFKVNYFLFQIIHYIVIDSLNSRVKLIKYIYSQIQVLNQILFHLLMKMLVLLNREPSDLLMVSYMLI